MFNLESEADVKMLVKESVMRKALSIRKKRDMVSSPKTAIPRGQRGRLPGTS